jgi:hypothetical protein
MKADEIEKLVKEFGFKNAEVFITDGDYGRPTTDYLTGKFYEFYSGWLSDHNLSQWRSTWDCDNFSSTYYVFCQMCHAKADRKEEGIAVGELFYKQDAGGGHAINLAVTEKGIIIIEPQNGQEMTLSKKEKENCWLIRF